MKQEEDERYILEKVRARAGQDELKKQRKVEKVFKQCFCSRKPMKKVGRVIEQVGGLNNQSTFINHTLHKTLTIRFVLEIHGIRGIQEFRQIQPIWPIKEIWPI